MDSGADVAGDSAEAKMFHEEHFLPESGSFCGNTTGDSPERRNRWVAQEGGFDLGPLGNRCSTRNIRVTCIRTPRSSRGLIVLFWAARDLPGEHSRKSSSGTTQSIRASLRSGKTSSRKDTKKPAAPKCSTRNILIIFTTPCRMLGRRCLALPTRANTCHPATIMFPTFRHPQSPPLFSASFSTTNFPFPRLHRAYNDADLAKRPIRTFARTLAAPILRSR